MAKILWISRAVLLDISDKIRHMELPEKTKIGWLGMVGDCYGKIYIEIFVKNYLFCVFSNSHSNCIIFCIWVIGLAES